MYIFREELIHCFYCNKCIVRSTMPVITALGVAMAARHAEEIDVWDLEGEEIETVPTDTFLPTTTPEGTNFF